MMLSSVVTTILAAGTIVSATPCRRSQTASMTPHDSYSSSIGVPGCKINTNQVAYWPNEPDCNNICVRVSHEDRVLYLLAIDHSGGAFDISYAAWNYLVSGQSVTEAPQMGGGVDMEYEFVDPSHCAPLLDNGNLPLSAANSMNFLASCLAQPDSWVAQHYTLYNLLDPTCDWGVDEVCDVDLSISNQPSCPSQLGVPVKTTGLSVMNFAYGTGKEFST